MVAVPQTCVPPTPTPFIVQYTRIVLSGIKGCWRNVARSREPRHRGLRALWSPPPGVTADAGEFSSSCFTARWWKSRLVEDPDDRQHNTQPHDLQFILWRERGCERLQPSWHSCSPIECQAFSLTLNEQLYSSSSDKRKKANRKQNTINTEIQSICKTIKRSLVCSLQNKL